MPDHWQPRIVLLYSSKWLRADRLLTVVLILYNSTVVVANILIIMQRWNPHQQDTSDDGVSKYPVIKSRFVYSLINSIITVVE